MSALLQMMMETEETTERLSAPTVPSWNFPRRRLSPLHSGVDEPMTKPTTARKRSDFPITPPRAPATKLKTAHLDQRNYHGARQAHEQTNKQKNGSRHGETYRLGLVLVQETQADLGEGAAMAGRSGHRSAAVARAPRWVRESGDRG
jgi:hypothetical protein